LGKYGDKTSLVIVVNTRTGLGATVPHGELNASFGSFGTGNGGFNLAYGGNSCGTHYVTPRAVTGTISFRF
jgi:hypothetical protein